MKWIKLHFNSYNIYKTKINDNIDPKSNVRQLQNRQHQIYLSDFSTENLFLKMCRKDNLVLLLMFFEVSRLFINKYLLFSSFYSVLNVDIQEPK